LGVREPLAKFFCERLGAVNGCSSSVLRSPKPLRRTLCSLGLGAQMPVEMRDELDGVVRGDARSVRGLHALLEIHGARHIRVGRAREILAGEVELRRVGLRRSQVVPRLGEKAIAFLHPLSDVLKIDLHGSPY
jgi:hypothetical protein